MAYSALLFKLWAFIPKKLLALLAALIFTYFWGVSDGRAPYELADKIQAEKAKTIVNQAQKNKSTIKQKGAKAHEHFKSYDCPLSLDDAARLSNIKP